MGSVRFLEIVLSQCKRCAVQPSAASPSTQASVPSTTCVWKDIPCGRRRYRVFMARALSVPVSCVLSAQHAVVLYPVGRRATSWRHSGQQVAWLLRARFTVDSAERKFGQAGSRCTESSGERSASTCGCVFNRGRTSCAGVRTASEETATIPIILYGFYIKVVGRSHSASGGGAECRSGSRLSHRFPRF